VDAIIEPILLYAGLAVGAVGLLLALPRKGLNPQLIGLVIAAAGFGGVIGLLAWNAFNAGETISPFFYIFAGIAVLSAIRVVTHQLPVYSALYFILTILSSSALYLLVGAEFMAFALIIIYAGAILITYLFVIMLATQAPSEGDVGVMSPYDAYAREPVAATAAGFLLLAVLTGMLASGVPRLSATGDAGAGVTNDPALLGQLPGRVIRGLEVRGAFSIFAEPERSDLVDGIGPVELAVDEASPRVTLIVKEGGAERLADRLDRGDARLEALLPEGLDAGAVRDGDEISLFLPPDIRPTNLDGVGWTLVAGHPVTLEIAGVILLMALLGAVVLARKQIELGEDEKQTLARVMAEGGTLPGPTSGEDEAFEGARGDGSQGAGGEHRADEQRGGGA
jgi:NADH-quinone oxidoreductase subunit J